MTKRLLGLTISMVLTLILLATTMYAYYFDRKETGSVDLTLGEVSFVWSGAFVTDFVMPAQELIDSPFTLNNQSTVETELRFSVIASTSLLGTVDLEDIFTVYEFDTDWVLESDGYYYYRGTDADSTSEPGKYKIPTNVLQIPVLLSLKLDGYVIRNEHIGQTVTVSLTFQAKQGPFIDWATLGSTNYNFSTGQ
jgi:hypothetical protein